MTQTVEALVAGWLLGLHITADRTFADTDGANRLDTLQYQEGNRYEL
jgi:hypothetical protein